MRFHLIITLVFSIALVSCKQTSLKKYYFNFEEFRQGKIYKFVDSKDADNIFYWHMKYKKSKGHDLFFTYGLDKKLTTQDVFIEKLKKDKSGSFLYESYSIFEDTIKIDSYTLKSEVYSFKASQYPIEWSLMESGLYGKNIFTKKREISKINTQQKVFGKNYDCILFRDKFDFEYPDSTYNFTYYRDIYYAKNLGVVRYIQYSEADSIVGDFHLVEILTEDFLKDNYIEFQRPENN